jgi:hypothetical protein
MSAGNVSTGPPSRAALAISVARLLEAFAPAAAIVTFAPWPAKAFAIARPSPEPPPVTMIERPERIVGEKKSGTPPSPLPSPPRGGRGCVLRKPLS